MRTGFQLKSYEHIEDRCCRYRLPGDEWAAEGVIRVNVSALQRAIRYEPGFFLPGTVPVAIEYGPGDWRVIDVCHSELSDPSLDPERRVWKVSADLLLPFLWEEEDVRRYLAHWNYVISYQERRQRMTRRVGADEEEDCFGGGDGSLTATLAPEQVWTAILSEAPVVTVKYPGEELLADRRVLGPKPQQEPVELMTRSGRWFGMYRKQEQLYICEAKYMVPGCPVTFDRKIRKKEVAALLPFYMNWKTAADEEEVCRQARQISVSYEYIFTMIRQYAI